MMIKIRMLPLCLLCVVAVNAEIPNPVFNGKDNQISVHFGQSLWGGGIEELFNLGVCYSQPNRFFRLPGRQSVELMTQFGFGDYSKYNQDAIFGFAQDVMTPDFWRLYAGYNLGIYIKTQITGRIGSRFTFGQRAFLGFRAADNLNLELFRRHFSNGDLTEQNLAQNFIGLNAAWSF
jgi:hypothetical protein